MNELISVIIPVYNAEKTLERCIDSILNQTYDKLEIIIVEDGSKDSSLKICKEYEKKYSNIKVIHQENLGANAARKTGIKVAKGDYVSFIDSDDWLSANMYKCLLEPFHKYEIDISMCAYYEATDDTKQIKNLIYNGFYNRNEMEKNIFPYMISDGTYFGKSINSALWNKLFRKSIIYDECMESIDDIEIGEDAAILYPTLLKAKGIYVYGKQALYNYYVNPNSVMNNYKNDLFRKSVIWMHYVIDRCKRVYPNKAIEKQIEFYFACLSITSIANEYKKNRVENEKYRQDVVKAIVNDTDFQIIIRRIEVSKLSMMEKMLFGFAKYRKYKIIHFIFCLREKKNRMGKTWMN